jgi:hypothetical protein
MVAAVAPNLNMIHKLKMSTAEYYPFPHDSIRRILNLHPYGHNADGVGLLVNNKILSAYAIKYVLLSDKSSASLVPHFSFNELQPVSIAKDVPDLTLISKDGSWSGRATSVSLEKQSIYEIRFEAKGNNTDSLHVSIFSHELKRNILLFSIQEISTGWKVYNKMIITTQPLPKCEFHVYSKSSTPISIKNITIKKLPFLFDSHPIEHQKVYQRISRDKTSGMVLLENKHALTLVFCVNQVEQLNTIEDFYQKAWATHDPWDPSKTAFIASQKLPDWKLGPGHCSVTILGHGLNYIEISTFSPNNHFLVFNDSYLPGWKAWKDEKEVDIYSTNGMMKGIYVSGGHHKILFQYRPPGFYWGLMATVLGFVVLTLLLCMHYRYA